MVRTIFRLRSQLKQSGTYNFSLQLVLSIQVQACIFRTYVSTICFSCSQSRPFIMLSQLLSTSLSHFSMQPLRKLCWKFLLFCFSLSSYIFSYSSWHRLLYWAYSYLWKTEKVSDIFTLMSQNVASRLSSSLPALFISYFQPSLALIRSLAFLMTSRSPLISVFLISSRDELLALSASYLLAILFRIQSFLPPSFLFCAGLGPSSQKQEKRQAAPSSSLVATFLQVPSKVVLGSRPWLLLAVLLRVGCCMFLMGVLVLLGLGPVGDIEIMRVVLFLSILNYKINVHYQLNAIHKYG